MVVCNVCRKDLSEQSSEYTIHFMVLTGNDKEYGGELLHLCKRHYETMKSFLEDIMKAIEIKMENRTSINWRDEYYIIIDKLEKQDQLIEQIKEGEEEISK